MQLVIKHRFMVAVLFAGLFLMLFGFYKPDNHLKGIPEKMFWSVKSEWKNCLTMTVGGDSRTYRGVSPETINSNEYLQDYKVGNYGFISNGWTKKYLAALERTLDKDSDKPLVLVLGLTPYSLTDLAARDNSFIRMEKVAKTTKMESIWFGRLYQFFSPINVNKLFVAKAKGNTYFQHYHENGWVASYRKKDVPRSALDQYKKRYKKKKVNKKMVKDVISYVKRWNKKNIVVFGYRPPTTQEMWELEELQSGYNEDDIAKRFSDAGGVWLKFENKYHSYDGSHLREDGAIEFSTDLAALIAEHLKKLQH